MILAGCNLIKKKPILRVIIDYLIWTQGYWCNNIVKGPNSSGQCVHVQWTFFLNTNWRARAVMATMALSRPDVWSLPGNLISPLKIAPSRTLTLVAEGSLHSQSNWSKRPEKMLPHRRVSKLAPACPWNVRCLWKLISTPLDSRVVNFTRAEKGESAFLAVGVNRTGRRAKSVVIIVMDVVNSLLVEINGAGLSSALLDRSCRRRRRRRPPKK